MTGIPKIQGFTVYKAEHIDASRGVVADITARDALDANWRYEGLLTYVEDSDGSNNGALYCLIDGITNSHWVKIAGSSGSAKAVVTRNKNGFEGIEIGTNIFANPKSSPDLIIEIMRADGQTLDFNPIVSQISPYDITLYSGATLSGAKLIIL